MLALASAVVSLSLFQLVVCCLTVVAFIALSFWLGIDEGKNRGVRLGRALEREALDKAREDFRNEHWFPVGRGHG